MKKILLGSIAILLLLTLLKSNAEKTAQQQLESRNPWERLTFSMAGSGAGWRYSCDYNEVEDIWYLFLPAGIPKEDLLIQNLPCEYLAIDGKRYQTGDDLAILWKKEGSNITFFDKTGKQLAEGKIKVMKSENIPSLHIATASGEMQYLYESKDNKEAANLRVLTETGTLAAAVRLDYIKGRGNTSWEVPKKSFEIRLDQPLGLLGMGKAKTWILLANYYDGSYLRNRIGMELEKSAGTANPTASQFADLYLNGHYAGLYQVAEKVGNSQNNGIPGGYLLEFDYLERIVGQAYILLENNQPIVIRGEKTVSEEEREQVQNFLAEMTAALYADDYINPETQKDIFEYLDKESFAQRYVMEEFLQNMDAGFSSHYMYLNGNGEAMHLSAGPLWDLDNTMGRGIVRAPSQLFANRYEWEVNNLTRWHNRLYANEEFFREIVKQYRAFAKPFLEWLLTAGIKTWEEEIAAAVLMDEARFLPPRSVFMPDSTKAEHMDYLTDYITGKMLFLNRRWDDTPEAWWLWHEDRQTELPPIQEQVHPTAENIAEEAVKNDDNPAAANWRAKIISGIIAYKGYLLFGCLLFFLLLMLGKEISTHVKTPAGKKRTEN